MAISYNPKVGEVLECNFGELTPIGDDGIARRSNFNGRMPPEMVKQRMVVVLNGKLGDGCLVVPISSTKNIKSIHGGVHVSLDPKLFKVTDFYDIRERWAKAEVVQQVSKKRLFKMRDKNGPFSLYMPPGVVVDIQKAVITAIKAKGLIVGQPVESDRTGTAS
jgi:uncharacterized protein YifN (PemK superfamily)